MEQGQPRWPAALRRSQALFDVPLVQRAGSPALRHSDQPPRSTKPPEAILSVDHRASNCRAGLRTAPIEGLATRMLKYEDRPPLTTSERERLSCPRFIKFGCEGVLVFEQPDTLR